MNTYHFFMPNKTKAKTTPLLTRYSFGFNRFNEGFDWVRRFLLSLSSGNEKVANHLRKKMTNCRTDGLKDDITMLTMQKTPGSTQMDFDPTNPDYEN